MPESVAVCGAAEAIAQASRPGMLTPKCARKRRHMASLIPQARTGGCAESRKSGEWKVEKTAALASGWNRTAHLRAKADHERLREDARMAAAGAGFGSSGVVLLAASRPADLAARKCRLDRP